MKGTLVIYSLKTPQEIHDEDQPTKRRNPDRKRAEAQSFQTPNSFSLGSLAKATTEKYSINSTTTWLKTEHKISQGGQIGSQMLANPIYKGYVIAAESQTYVACLSQKACDQALQSLNTVYKKRAKLLQHAFINSNDAVLSKLSLYFSEQAVTQGKTICSSGDEVDKLYCVLEGEVKVTTSTERYLTAYTATPNRLEKEGARTKVLL